MKYGLVGLILIAVLCAGGIYYYQHQHKYFNVYDAQVTSSLVAAKVHGNAVITEKVVEDGEHVEDVDAVRERAALDLGILVRDGDRDGRRAEPCAGTGCERTAQQRFLAERREC